jgi:GT2 family glycosyltransferase
MPRLSVIIVTFNSAREIGGCLQALRDTPPRLAHEILVVDNASTDDTLAVLARDWPDVRVLTNDANRGFGAATNRGIRETSGDRLLILNPDARVTAGAIDRLLAALDAEPAIAIAGPRLVDDAGRAEVSYGRHIGPLAELGQKLRVRAQEGRWPVVGAWIERQTQVARFPDWVSGACWVARRDVLDAVGLFDERFFLYTEDVDLCARVRGAGHRVAFVPGAVVRHTRGASRAGVRDTANAHYRRSHVAFYEKHHPGWAPLLRTYLKLKGALPDTTKQAP